VAARHLPQPAVVAHDRWIRQLDQYGLVFAFEPRQPIQHIFQSTGGREWGWSPGRRRRVPCTERNEVQDRSRRHNVTRTGGRFRPRVTLWRNSAPFVTTTRRLGGPRVTKWREGTRRTTGTRGTTTTIPEPAGWTGATAAGVAPLAEPARVTTMRWPRPALGPPSRPGPSPSLRPIRYAGPTPGEARR
jgi:hypothetical protein